MACKFMVNLAFEARLLLRPSHQRTILFGTVNKLGCPIPGRPTLPLILSSRSYSESTPTPPFPKTSGSSQDSESSGPKDKNWFSREGWVKGKVWAEIIATTTSLGLITYTTQPIWGDLYQQFQRRVHESARESEIYDILKNGPVFEEEMPYIIQRDPLLKEIKRIVTPTERNSLYPLVVGEHGTGITTLIQLAVNSIDEPKGVVYVDMPIDSASEVDVTKAMQEALGWSPDPLIDPSEPVSLWDILRGFSKIASKYKQEYNRVPVLIIDNADRLAVKHQSLLNMFQDYAGLAVDQNTVTVIFVLREGYIPCCMRATGSWSRHGHIVEIGDVSKEEALQYLKLRSIDEEEAAQIYELTNGRMIHLKYIADHIKRGGTLEAMRQIMFSDAKSQLKSAEIFPGHRYYKDGAVIIRELLKKGSISDDTYFGLIDPYIGDKLLKTNVFAMQVISREITFQSTVMKRFCEENSALYSIDSVGKE